MIMRDEHIRPLLIIISVVIIRAVVTRRRLLSRSLADKVDIRVVVDFVVLEIRELVHEVLQRLEEGLRLSDQELRNCAEGWLLQ